MAKLLGRFENGEIVEVTDNWFEKWWIDAFIAAWKRLQQ
jgi:hypothetical protein